jgi:hypothetical protein
MNTTTWMDIKGITLREKIQFKMLHTMWFYLYSFIYSFIEVIEMETDEVVARSSGCDEEVV